MELNTAGKEFWRVSKIGDIYRRIMALFMDRPSRFSWIDKQVAASGRPMTRRQVEWIRAQGINMIISLTEQPLPRELIENMGLEYRHFPIEDHSAPSPEILRQIVDEIFSSISRGKRVLIHCAAGLGRTGTILAAYLVALKEISGEEAIRRVRELRPGSIETIQERSILEFQKRYFPKAAP